MLRLHLAKVVQMEADMARGKTKGAQIRKQALESQLATATALCGLAETAIRFGQRSKVHTLLNKVRRGADSIRSHIDEPNHVPEDSRNDLRNKLTQLEKLANEVEFRLRQS